MRTNNVDIITDADPFVNPEKETDLFFNVPPINSEQYVQLTEDEIKVKGSYTDIELKNDFKTISMNGDHLSLINGEAEINIQNKRTMMGRNINANAEFNAEVFNKQDSKHKIVMQAGKKVGLSETETEEETEEEETAEEEITEPEEPKPSEASIKVTHPPFDQRARVCVGETCEIFDTKIKSFKTSEVRGYLNDEQIKALRDSGKTFSTLEELQDYIKKGNIDIGLGVELTLTDANENSALIASSLVPFLGRPAARALKGFATKKDFLDGFKDDVTKRLPDKKDKVYLQGVISSLDSASNNPKIPSNIYRGSRLFIIVPAEGSGKDPYIEYKINTDLSGKKFVSGRITITDQAQQKAIKHLIRVSPSTGTTTPKEWNKILETFNK